MQDPKLYGQLEEGITSIFYDLMRKLKSIEGLLTTMNRFGILTDTEMRVIYHDSHTKCIEQMRQT